MSETNIREEMTESDRPRSVPTTSDRYSFRDRMIRLVRYRLVVPLKRGWKLPVYTARGVGVGMAWAMTPLVGIQMPLVFITWLLVHRLLKWEFNLLVGFAWTWVTNVVTMLPIYYVFYLTGKVMLGRWDELGGYDSFVASWNQAFANGNGFVETTLALARVLLEDFGMTMMVGSLPYAVVLGWLSYHWSLRYLLAHRESRDRRRRKRRP